MQETFACSARIPLRKWTPLLISAIAAVIPKVAGGETCLADVCCERPDSKNSLQVAIRSAKPGSEIEFMGYCDTIRVDGKSRLTIKGFANDRAFAFLENFLIRKGSEQITIRHVTIAGTQPSRIVRCSNCVVSDVTFKKPNWIGQGEESAPRLNRVLALVHSSNVQVLASTFEGGFRHGIQIRGGSRIYISNNTIEKGSGWGINLIRGALSPQYVHVSGNTIRGHAAGGVRVVGCGHVVFNNNFRKNGVAVRVTPRAKHTYVANNSYNGGRWVDKGQHTNEEGDCP